MADKILRKENDQFVYSDLVGFTNNVGFGFNATVAGEIHPDDLPLTLNIFGSDAISIPSGPTNLRPVVDVPMFRYNSQLGEFELYSPLHGTWATITDDYELSGLEAQVALNTVDIAQHTIELADHELRLDILEYIDIDIMTFTCTTGTILEFGAESVDYLVGLAWTINKPPTLAVLESQSYGSVTLPNTETGSHSDTYGITNTTGAELSKWWRLVVNDVLGPLHSDDTASLRIYWVYPYYYGTSVNDLGTVTTGDLTKNISRRGTKIIHIDGTNEFIYFGYPAAYPNLTSIKDGNGFEVLSSFTQHIVPINTTSGITISYKLYKTDSLTTVDQDYTFTY